MTDRERAEQVAHEIVQRIWACKSNGGYIAEITRALLLARAEEAERLHVTSPMGHRIRAAKLRGIADAL